MRHISCWRFAVSAAGAVLFILSAAPGAAAQDPDARRLSVGAGAGIATPFHGDFDFTATAWQVDIQFDVSRHLGFGVFLEEWRHSEEQVFGAHAIFGASGVIGSVAQTTTRTEHTTRAVGWNLLAKVPVGRVTLHGGGGVSYLFYARDYSQTMSGCESSQPVVCSDYDNRFTNSSFSGQVQGGADVGITHHIAVTGLFRVVVPTQDPGGGHSTLTAGIRVGF